LFRGLRKQIQRHRGNFGPAMQKWKRSTFPTFRGPKQGGVPERVTEKGGGEGGIGLRAEPWTPHKDEVRQEKPPRTFRCRGKPRPRDRRGKGEKKRQTESNKVKHPK